jgi:hypothetical protein
MRLRRRTGGTRRLKLVKHAHTISLFGIWYDDDLLVVGMELAEGSLMDELRAAVARGLAGVPVRQLIGHMRANISRSSRASPRVAGGRTWRGTIQVSRTVEPARCEDP